MSWFYKEKELRTEMSVDDFRNIKRKYFWDGNNWDKWRKISCFWYPISHIIVENISQPWMARILDLESEYLYSCQDDWANKVILSII